MGSDSRRLVKDMLDEYGDLARGTLQKYLKGGEPRRHLYDKVADYPERGGRMLRASLCIASARAHGAKLEDSLNTAVSLELMHNAFLVHDDVEDDGEARRGKPTLHALHGVPVAVNVGDALAVVALQPLLDNRPRLGPRLTLRVLEESARMARESVEGQAIELGWRNDNALSLVDDDYLDMILKKTCWYTTIHPSRVGALIGTQDGIDLDRFVQFGFFLGAAFQIQDDVLNLVGDRARYGKELEGDLFEGKRTLCLIHLLRNIEADERARVGEALAKPRAQRSAHDVRYIRSLVDQHGSVEYARSVAHGLAGAALHEFEHAFADLPPSRDLDFIEGLARWTLERS